MEQPKAPTQGTTNPTSSTLVSNLIGSYPPSPLLYRSAVEGKAFPNSYLKRKLEDIILRNHDLEESRKYYILHNPIGIEKKEALKPSLSHSSTPLSVNSIANDPRKRINLKTEIQNPNVVRQDFILKNFYI
jgi:hypothetical protein